MDTLNNCQVTSPILTSKDIISPMIHFKDEGIASTTPSNATTLQDTERLLETYGQNILISGDKTKFEVHRIAEGKYEFCKNWVENSEFDSKSTSDTSSISASTIYSSSAVDTESEISEVFSGVRINKEFNQTDNNNRASKISSVIQSSTPSMQTLPNNQIDIIQQVFRGENSVQSFGDIHVENSNRVHIGNITYVTGPIHIVHTNGGGVDTINQMADGNKSVHRNVETTTSKISNSHSYNRTRSSGGGPSFKINDDYLDEETEESNSPNIFIGKDINQAIDGKVLKVVDRRTWLAQPPLSSEEMDTPVPYVIIIHTATEMTSTQAETVYMVRNIQTYHIESRNWHDIAYNFLIGCDGNVYEGRGWKRIGAHSIGYNKRSIGISFVGCFMNDLPPAISLDACKLLIKKGVEDGYIAQDYKLIGHCQCRPTESPGRVLFEEIKTWPSWAESP